MDPVVESNRDLRVLEWLIAQVGDEAVANACKQLAGRRRPYPSNIAKFLGLVPPADLTVTPTEDAKRHLQSIKVLLNSHQKKGGSDGKT